MCIYTITAAGNDIERSPGSGISHIALSLTILREFMGPSDIRSTRGNPGWATLWT